jgi:endonuclease/exonuclease/phosphatase family metal-dependent hydrolase
MGYYSYFKNLLIFSIILIFICSCGDTKVIPARDSSTVTIGTFNMSWLGEGLNDKIDRSESDYKEIANIILQTGCDVIAIQEVENDRAMDRIIKYMPGFSYFVSKEGGKQNVGVLYYKDVTVSLVGEYMPIAVEKNRTRPGLVINCKKGNFDWVMMAVHFKSTSHYDKTPEDKDESRDTRQLQAEIAQHWADSIIRNSKEKDIIIAGDFNDTPLRKLNNTLLSLYQDPDLVFLTDSMKSCKLKAMYVIDQIVVSRSAFRRFIPNSQRTFDFFSSLPKEKASMVSDHCPIITKFEVTSQDNSK